MAESFRRAALMTSATSHVMEIDRFPFSGAKPC